MQSPGERMQSTSGLRVAGGMPTESGVIALDLRITPGFPSPLLVPPFLSVVELQNVSAETRCAVTMSQIDEELKTVRKLLSRRDGPTSDFNGDPLDPLEAGPLNPTDSTLLHVIAPGHTLPRCFSTPPECLRRHFRKQT